MLLEILLMPLWYIFLMSALSCASLLLSHECCFNQAEFVPSSDDESESESSDDECLSHPSLSESSEVSHSWLPCDERPVPSRSLEGIMLLRAESIPSSSLPPLQVGTKAHAHGISHSARGGEMREALVLAPSSRLLAAVVSVEGMGGRVDGLARIAGQLRLAEGRGCSCAINQQRCGKACMNSTLNPHGLSTSSASSIIPSMDHRHQHITHLLESVSYFSYDSLPLSTPSSSLLSSSPPPP